MGRLSLTHVKLGARQEQLKTRENRGIIHANVT
jgi:hypothetical protein